MASHGPFQGAFDGAFEGHLREFDHFFRHLMIYTQNRSWKSHHFKERGWGKVPSYNIKEEKGSGRGRWLWQWALGVLEFYWRCGLYKSRSSSSSCKQERGWSSWLARGGTATNHIYMLTFTQLQHNGGRESAGRTRPMC